MLMYPIFITDDPDASVEIKTLPGQRRWGVNKLEEFLGPLVKKGLKSVILFGVPMNCEKVSFFGLICVSCGFWKQICGHSSGERTRTAVFCRCSHPQTLKSNNVGVFN